MAEAKEKKERVVQSVTMTDGRKVEFVGTRRVLKETLIDESKVQIDGELLVIQPGAVSVRMDFVNGETRTFPLSLGLLAQFAGHGAEQKYGDELAAPSDKPLSTEDMVIAVDDLHERLAKGEWRMKREGTGDSFAGASIVIRALMEASGKDQTTVKAFLQGKLDAAKERGEKLSRKELYDSFRVPTTKVGQIIERLERERLSKSAKVDADAEVDALAAM